MGLCDENSAAALFRELPGEFVRRPPGHRTVPNGTTAYIEIDLVHKATNYQIVTRITSLKSYERVSQRHEQGGTSDSTIDRKVGLFRLGRNGERVPIKESDFPWHEIFVSAYGPGMRTQGILDYQWYLAVDAVYPLFSYTAPLQNPELIYRRIVDTTYISGAGDQRRRAKKALKQLETLLKTVLNLEPSDAISLTPTGIEVTGHWGTAELGELGDGYRATVTWVLDLVGWWFINRTRWPQGARENDFELDTDDFRGIVLIDELEQHLHPRWQRRILGKLHTCFPRLQFIATTHSPLCAIGATDLKDEDVNLIVLEPSDGQIRARLFDPPRGKRADQILTSELFGLRIASDNATQSEIEEFAALASKTRNRAEETRFKKLGAILDTKLGSAQTELERVVAEGVRKVLLGNAEPSSEKAQAMQYEILRQLRALLK
jgi:hypothetical protein